MLAAIGVTGAHDVHEKFNAFITEANKNKLSMAENQTTIADLQASIKSLEGKLLTEARVKEICGESATSVIAAWAGSEAGKKIIGGEASRITMEALASIGTTPAKPAPVGGSGNDNSKDLVAQGKFKEAYAANPALVQTFSTAESYEAYMKAVAAGHVQPE